jgi:hypothetical protein
MAELEEATAAATAGGAGSGAGAGAVQPLGDLQNDSVMQAMMQQIGKTAVPAAEVDEGSDAGAGGWSAEAEAVGGAATTGGLAAAAAAAAKRGGAPTAAKRAFFDDGAQEERSGAQWMLHEQARADATAEGGPGSADGRPQLQSAAEVFAAEREKVLPPFAAHSIAPSFIHELHPALLPHL